MLTVRYYAEARRRMKVKCINFTMKAIMAVISESNERNDITIRIAKA